MAWTVYELSNEAVREVYLVATASNLIDELKRIRLEPPRPIAHWPLAARRTLTVLEVCGDSQAAVRLLHERLGEKTSLGWRVTAEMPQADHQRRQ